MIIGYISKVRLVTLLRAFNKVEGCVFSLREMEIPNYAADLRQAITNHRQLNASRDGRTLLRGLVQGAMEDTAYLRQWCSDPTGGSSRQPSPFRPSDWD